MVMMIDKKAASHYSWGQNCNSWILADTDGLSIKQESMPPGTQEQLHFHAKAQQFFFILKGNATFYCNGEKSIVEAQMGILIPAGTRHYIANETPDEIEFLVISQPTTANDRENC